MEKITYNLSWLSLIPFVLTLIAVAVVPITAPRFWRSNRNKALILAIIAVPTLIWLTAAGMKHELVRTMFYDYVPFIVLIGSLYIITGGIFFDSNIKASPLTNSVFLVIAAVLGSIMGTTGTAMIMIRPLLHINSKREHKIHSILFFIAIAANSSGLLSPIGDPPLFMMFLRGVPFFWFLKLFWVWLFTNGALILIYYFVDKYYFGREAPEVRTSKEKPVYILQGKLNFVWLAGVILAVAFINPARIPILNEQPNMSFLRELIITIMAILSMKLTSQAIRDAHHFDWEPLEEVAYIFAGIFITLVPCLIYMEENAINLGVTSKPHFYYATGILSSFLDNTPVSVMGHSLARGLVQVFPSIATQTSMIAGIPEIIMKAICSAAVLFGAMTYIGNGPNFLIRSIVEQRDIKMPHFFAYMYKFSLIVVLPILILVQLIFF